MHNHNIQPYLFWILLLFLGVGMFYPAVGLVAILCMIAPIAVAPFRGRFWCGNYCPRGSFYDSVLAKVSPRKKIPQCFSSKILRGFMILFIMTVFAMQMYYAWGDLPAMGMVVIRLILITTLVGILLGLFFHHRTWCAFCPMGSLASWISAKRKPLPLLVNQSCVNCRLCEKVCPMQLTPCEAKDHATGFTHSDCLKCGRCVNCCPRQALAFRSRDFGREEC